VLSRGQAERGSKAFWDAEQFDRHTARCWGTRIASQPLWKVEAIMRALCTGEGQRRDIWIGRASRLAIHLQVLAVQLYARSPMKSPTPVTPEKRSRSHSERTEQQTDLKRLGSGAALPLTLVAQRAGAATANAGRIDHAQAPIGLSAPLMGTQGLPSRATQYAIRLGNKVATRKATSFPGQGFCNWSIVLDRGWGG
jgi:hypothetical protein